METSVQQIWSRVLARLREQLSQPTFTTWIEATKAETFCNNCLVLRTPNPFVLNHIKKYYLSLIAQVVGEIVGQTVEIKLIAEQGETIAFIRDDVAEKSKNTDLTPKFANYPAPCKLNPKYTFYRFVVGANNRMAHAAALAVAESPGRDFNPLFLCGGVGLGKTHLMQAIGDYRLQISQNAKVFYVSTEQFTNDLIAAIRHDSIESFRQHYRSADLLLVDDIQFIEGKESTQEEFFHTFNTLHEAGKQIVLASDRQPYQIPHLQARLTSRFSMGLIADIQSPDLETRMAILQKKAEEENMRLPREVIEYIATLCTSNIRELEGTLIRSLAYISISGLPMSVESLAQVLHPRRQNIYTTPAIIMQALCDTFCLSIDDLKSSSRRRKISHARQIGMYLMRKYTDLSFPRIGEEFGGKDHTTVMYSCEKINAQQKKQPELAQTISRLCDRISFMSHNLDGS